MPFSRRLILILALTASPLRGDTFYLYGGGKVEGRLLNPAEQPRKIYQIQTHWGVVQLDDEQVKRVVTATESERKYEEYLLKMPATLDGNWRMAEWCRNSGLERQRVRHLERILELDPNHEGARRALGFGRNAKGQWQLSDIVQRDSGYIYYGGKWMLPEDILLTRQSRDRELAEKGWKSKIRMWRTWISKQRGKEQEAEQNLRAIRDPQAAPGLIDLLEESDEPQSLKRLYIEVLGGMGEGVGAMIKLALEDSDRTIRSLCLDQLERNGRVAATRAFVAALSDSDNQKVNRAAVGLAQMKDPSSIMPLIDALLTEHKFQTPAGPAFNPTFTGDGGGSFGVGGKPKIIKREIQNQAVRDALAVILGVNHGFDKERWRQWYVTQNSPENFQLRRGN